MAQTNAQAALPSMSRWRPEHLAAVVRVSQGLVQVRVVKHLPEPIYGLPISLRMVGSHPLDCSQCKREECVAAALQDRSYRLRTDEFAESQYSRGIGKIMRRGRFWLRRFCATLMASTIMRSELIGTKTRRSQQRSNPGSLVFKTFGFNIMQSFPTKFTSTGSHCSSGCSGCSSGAGSIGASAARRLRRSPTTRRRLPR